MTEPDSLDALARSAHAGHARSLISLLHRMRPFIERHAKMKRPSQDSDSLELTAVVDEVLASTLYSMWSREEPPSDFVRFMFNITNEVVTSTELPLGSGKLDDVVAVAYSTTQPSLPELLSDPDISAGFAALPARARQALTLTYGYMLRREDVAEALDSEPEAAALLAELAMYTLVDLLDSLVEQEASRDDWDNAPRTGDPFLDSLISDADGMLDEAGRANSARQSPKLALDAVGTGDDQDADDVLDGLLRGADEALRDALGLARLARYRSQAISFQDDASITNEELERRRRLGDPGAALIYFRRLARTGQWDLLEEIAASGDDHARLVITFEWADHLIEGRALSHDPALPEWFSLRVRRRYRYATDAYYRRYYLYPYPAGGWYMDYPWSLNGLFGYPPSASDRDFLDRLDAAELMSSQAIAGLIERGQDQPDGFALVALARLRQGGGSISEIVEPLRLGVQLAQPRSFLILHDILLDFDRYGEAAELRRLVIYGPETSGDIQ